MPVLEIMVMEAGGQQVSSAIGLFADRAVLRTGFSGRVDPLYRPYVHARPSAQLLKQREVRVDCDGTPVQQLR